MIVYIVSRDLAIIRVPRQEQCDAIIDCSFFNLETALCDNQKPTHGTASGWLMIGGSSQNLLIDFLLDFYNR